MPNPETKLHRAKVVAVQPKAQMTVVVLEGEDGVDKRRDALVADGGARELARHIPPLIAQLSRRRCANLEMALREGLLPAALVRELHGLLRDADDEVSSAKRKGRQDFMRGRF